MNRGALSKHVALLPLFLMAATAPLHAAPKKDSREALEAEVSYSYDELGNLVSAILPDGTSIGYIVDGHYRRVGKTINGRLVQAFLYRDGPFPVAELDGTGAVLASFIFSTRPNSPDTIVKGGRSYQVIADSLGSPRLVVDVENGSIAQKIQYDEFGRVISDTNPGFQPFGFSGGLYDPLTRLLRFGARDYDPETGRWTSKDPILFDGGDANLYGYTLNDPVNLYDLTGLYAQACRSGDQVQIAIPIQFSGDALTGQVEQRFRQGIEQRWSGKFGKLNVVAKAVVGPENQIEVRPGPGTSFVRWTNRSGIWFSDESGWVAAHEAGHLMGLPDRYRRRGDTTTPRQGHEGNIMAENNGAPSEADILRILEKNKPGGYCSCP